MKTKMLAILALLPAMAWMDLPGSVAPTTPYAKEEDHSEFCTIRCAPHYVCLFFDRYRPVAQYTSIQYQMPVSIQLAVAALESGYGRAESHLIQECNNFFHIKTYSATDETCCKEVIEYIEGMEVTTQYSCFRRYARPEDSFWDFCLFLQRDNYKALSSIPRWDYRRFAGELQKAGYATDPAYAEKLICIIEKYGLYLYDPLPDPHPYWGGPAPTEVCR